MLIEQTFALPDSEIPKAHIEIWETVRQAQYAPYKYLQQFSVKQPPHLYQLDVAARAVITSRLPSESGAQTPEPDFSIFTHRLGHGIGLQGHESPFLVQGSQGAPLAEPGQTFSLEPGVYLPKGGVEKRKGIDGLGVRHEDCFVIRATEDGMLDMEWFSGPVRGWGDV